MNKPAKSQWNVGPRCEGYQIHEEPASTAGVARVWSRLPTWPTVAPSFVDGVDAEAQGCPLQLIHKLGGTLRRLCLQKNRLGQVLALGGWLLLPIFDEGLAAVQKHVLEAQLKLRYCAIEQVLSFRNHGAFLEPLMAEQDSGHAGHHL
jgi:hypothetical protein